MITKIKNILNDYSMKFSEICMLLKKLSEEDKEKVKNTIWFLKEDCISNFDYIHNALELVELINDLKEKYDKSN